MEAALNALMACFMPRKDQSPAGPQDAAALDQAIAQLAGALPPVQKKFLEAIIVSSINSLAKSELPKIIYTDSLLEEMGAGITPATVAKAFDAFWMQKKEGHIISEKLYIHFDENNHAWTYGVLSGATKDHCGMKEIHFDPDHPTSRPLQKALVVTRQKGSGELYGVRAGETISKLRTGYSFLPTIDLQPVDLTAIVVVLFGAGEIGDAVAEFINLRADRIKGVYIFSNGGESNHRLAAKFNPKIQNKLVGTGDRKLISNGKIVVGATNAGKPLCTFEEMNPDATFLSLGIDDTPKEFMSHVLETKGIIILDDPKTHELRNTSSVARYYSRKGQKLTEHGDREVIMSIADALLDSRCKQKCLQWNGPRIVGPVGMAATDIIVGANDLNRLEDVLFA